MWENRINRDVPCCESATRPMQVESLMTSENLLARNINIIPLNHGYMVEVGCQRFAIESVDKMLKYVGEYLRDPQAVEKDWFSGELKLL